MKCIDNNIEIFWTELRYLTVIIDYSNAIKPPLAHICVPDGGIVSTDFSSIWVFFLNEREND